MTGLTIGIVTTGIENNHLLNEMVKSLFVTDDIEVIMIGGPTVSFINTPMLRHIPFDETIGTKGWITRKKNMLTQEARYDTILYTHDYFTFASNWVTSWKQFIATTEFDVAVNCIYTAEGSRHSDWVIDPFLLWETHPELHGHYWDVLLPYEENYTPLQYISGNFWVAKKSFMEKYPLNESLYWGDAEDIEWSARIRPHTTFRCNTNTHVTIQKHGKWAPNLITPEHLETMKRRFL